MSQFVKVASLMPDQHRCNLRLRVLSVEAITESVHPETGKIMQSAEAIVGDDTACILLRLKNEQVNLLSRNARLQILNGYVHMHRGFMRLEVDEDEDNHASLEDSESYKPSITAISEEDEEDELVSMLTCDGDKFGYDHSVSDSPSSPRFVHSNSSSIPATPITSNSPSSSPYRASSSLFAQEGSPASPPMHMSSSTPASSALSVPSSSSSTSLSSAASSLSSSTTSLTSSRDQMEIEMRLSTGGSVPLVEYYRSLEFDYFSTVEPVGR